MTTNNHTPFDAIIIGAGIAGSVCALTLANKGWRVAVVEKRQARSAYKKMCTHILHPYAVDQLEKLGLLDELFKKSAQMTCMNIHYNERSVFYPFAGKRQAANIERKDLDPALKNALTQHSHITLFAGYRLSSLIKSANQVIGVQCIPASGQKLSLKASVVIGSDGRNSAITKLCQGHFKKTDNQRVALFSYFSSHRNLTESHVWSLRQGKEYIGLFPNQQRLLVSWYLPREEFDNKTETHEQSFERLLAFIAEQGITLGDRLESVRVVKDSSPQVVSLSPNSLALIGDSKLAADPLTGIGCTWAMQSANLLAACLGQAPTQAKKSFFTIRLRILAYNCMHSLTFKLSSSLMTVVSMHGKWVFNTPVYRSLAWLTRKK